MFETLRDTKINPYRIVIFSFFLTIAAGAVLLSLPWMHAQAKSIPFIDCLFTAASAVCVTGLSTLDISREFTVAGQVVILTLIQIGGLGIMTLSTFVLLIAGWQMQVRDKFVLDNMFGESMSARSLLKYIVVSCFLCEGLGAAAISLRLYSHYDYPLRKALYHGVFHSVSAFCNAGFALYPDSLFRFRADPVVLGVITMLIIAGGLGFLVLYNMQRLKFWNKDIGARGKLILQSKMVLATTGVLLLCAMVVFLVLEWNKGFNGYTLQEKLLNAWFLAVTPRTAGFNTTDIGTLTNAALLFIMILMFIGASPGSTGGGIKTTTFAILVATCSARLKRKPEVEMFRKSLPQTAVLSAIWVTFMAMSVVLFFVFMLLITEDSGMASRFCPVFFFRNVLFEVISAFGTVGLSTGITPHLTDIGKLLLCCIMFVGRVGPLTIGYFLTTPQRAALKYSKENVMTG